MKLVKFKAKVCAVLKECPKYCTLITIQDNLLIRFPRCDKCQFANVNKSEVEQFHISLKSLGYVVVNGDKIAKLPDYGEQYFFLDFNTLEIYCDSYKNTWIDNIRYKNGNYFCNYSIAADKLREVTNILKK